jgi:hypothetical protein
MSERVHLLFFFPFYKSAYSTEREIKVYVNKSKRTSIFMFR